MSVTYDAAGDVESVTAENVTAAMSGDVKLALEALRDTLAATIDTCSTNMLPQVAGRYRNVLQDLAAIDAAANPGKGKPKPKRDDLRERRNLKIAAAAS